MRALASNGCLVAYTWDVIFFYPSLFLFFFFPVALQGPENRPGFNSLAEEIAVTGQLA